MLNYLFYDNETGEYFYVQEESLEAAWVILEEECEGDLEMVDFTGEFHSDYIAEMMGYDTY